MNKRAISVIAKLCLLPSKKIGRKSQILGLRKILTFMDTTLKQKNGGRINNKG